MKDDESSPRSYRNGTSSASSIMELTIDPARRRFPVCIVWTPIPFLTYFLPFIGHMGIATTVGIIRDFAGPCHVSEDKMGFGQPTKYWRLNCDRAKGGSVGWDAAVAEASEIYKTRMHNLCCDNCHSHVATALNLMSYDNSDDWNMVKLAFLMLVYSKYVGFWAFIKTWLPFSVIVAIVTLYFVFT